MILFRQPAQTYRAVFPLFFYSSPNLTPPPRTPIALTQKLWQNISYLQLGSMNNWFYPVMTIFAQHLNICSPKLGNNGNFRPHLTTIGGGTFCKVSGHNCKSKTVENFCGLNLQMWCRKPWNMTSLTFFSMCKQFYAMFHKPSKTAIYSTPYLPTLCPLVTGLHLYKVYSTPYLPTLCPLVPGLHLYKVCYVKKNVCVLQAFGRATRVRDRIFASLE